MPAERPGILVTRPEGQEEALCESLRRAGFPVSHQPLLLLEPLATVSATQRRLLAELDRFRHCIFISNNAVRFGLALIREASPRWPPALSCYAVGDSTAAALRAEGLAVQTPGETMTSEGLLALPALNGVAGERVLIVKGEGGRQALRKRLSARGARVSELACYRRRAPAVDPVAFRQQLERDRVRVILVSSGEALANLSALLRPGETHNFTAVTLVVPSARVATEAAEAGWTRVRVAANAADDAMLTALERWWSEQGDRK